MSFKQFNFFSSSQRIELDSFSFIQKASKDKGELVIQGDKFFFNSKHLPAIYQKNSLIIDTLYCLNPVLTLSENGVKQKKKDTAVTAKKMNNDLFKYINIKFIDVINGEMHLKNKSTDSSSTGAHKSNAAIYNLVIDNENDKNLSTDSIKVNLKNIEFYSKDSLAKLRINDFILDGADAVFRDVQYVPSEFNHYKRGITFVAPALVLTNIDIGELIKSRFKALSARLVQPSITVYNKNKPGVQEVRTVPQKGEAKMDLFYRSLHHISELLEVETFDIEKGNARYKKAAPKAIDLTVKNINAKFLLNKLFVSDSLVDIKHSIPDLRMGELNLMSKGTHIKVSNYRFDGVTRRNWGDQLMVATANGTVLTGRNIYWEVFDWDIYEKSKDIQVDYLRIGNLTVEAGKNNSGQKKPDAKKSLPVIRVARMQVNKISFTKKSINSNISASGNNFLAENVRSSDRFFNWDNVKVELYNISSTGNGTRIDIKNIAFNSNSESIIKQVNFDKDNEQGTTKLNVPLIKLKMAIHSSDLSNLSLQSISAGQASLNIFSKETENKKSARPVQMPLSILLHHIDFNNLKLSYATTKGKDTLNVNTTLDFKVSDIQTYKGDTRKLLAYKSIGVAMNNMEINKQNLSLKLPSSSLHLNNGSAAKNDKGKILIESALAFMTDKGILHYAKDSTSVDVNSFSLKFNDKNFVTGGEQKIAWQKLAVKTTMIADKISYDGKKINALCESFSIDQSGNRINLAKFSIIPKQTREESFAAAKWQNDYMIVKGDRLTVSGITFNNSPKDSSVTITYIMADGIDLNTSRDKSIPFLHGIEKLMPTKMLNKISLPLKIDSLELKNSTVTYNEFSVATKKWSTIALKM